MKLYSEIRATILTICDDVEISHIGSTAFQGLKTKGDLDINVRVKKDEFWNVINKIKNLGYYELQGTLQNDVLRHLKPIKKYNIDVAIQVTIFGSEFDTFVLFHEILLANKNARKDYSMVKDLYGNVSDEEYRERKSKVINHYLNSVRDIV